MTQEQLVAYLKLHYPKEDESCEWKSFANLTHNFSAHIGEDMISYVSAIANMEGGHLILGVEDKTLDIIGIQNFKDYTEENLSARLLGYCPNLSSEGLHVKSFTTTDTHKTVWVIHIPKHLPRKPVFAHKKAWQRKGDYLIPLTKEREDTILLESFHYIDDWSAVICQDATLNDLEPVAISKARDNYKNKFPDQALAVDSWNDTTFLNKAKVAIKGKITRAAILLLGKAESEHFINPTEAKIRWILKDKNNTERDYFIYSCPFLLTVDDLFNKVRNLKYRYLKSGTLFPEEVDQYEPYVIREALNNCIAHQDYTKSGRINVVERDDELIFTNHGNFIPGTVENVIREDAPEERYRNPFLATAMFNLKMVDTIGSGIRRMFTFQRNRFFPMPEYDFSSGKVKVTITGKVLDLDYAKVLAQNPQLSLEEIVMLDSVQKNKELLPDEVLLLKSKGLIEGKKPHYFISAKVAQTTNQKAAYTKHKAFSKQQYFDWIIQGLKDHPSLSRKDIEELLIRHLSDLYSEKQKKSKITNLLTELRKKGIIKNTGTDLNSKWILINENT